MTQTWLSNNLPDFWGKDVWMPSSPDCNPLDYYVWGACERRINRTPHSNLESLKAAIVTGFAELPKTKITLACSRYRSRIQQVIDTNGGFIK